MVFGLGTWIYRPEIQVGENAVHLEVTSTFYTSNPLLYISHYNEIIIHGLDTASAYESGFPSNPLIRFGKKELASRRELVEQLVPEPVFDYLVQNGAILAEDVKRIEAERSEAQRNLALLKHLDAEGSHALTLFVNALRYTGQHRLANLVDDSARLRAMSESGYLGKTRKKGQLRMRVVVRAVRFDVTNCSVPDLPEWLCMEDIESRMAALVNEADADATIYEEETAPPRSCCLCKCINKIFSRKKNGGVALKYVHKYANSKSSPATPLRRCSSIRRNMDPALRRKLRGKSQLSTWDSLNSLLDQIQQKSKRFHQTLVEPDHSGHLDLVKYLEQKRGVLVLQVSDLDIGLVLDVICTQTEHPKKLRDDLSTGKLRDQVQEVLDTTDLKQQLEIDGIKLDVEIDTDELDTVDNEMKKL